MSPRRKWVGWERLRERTAKIDVAGVSCPHVVPGLPWVPDQLACARKHCREPNTNALDGSPNVTARTKGPMRSRPSANSSATTYQRGVRTSSFPVAGAY